MAAISCFVFTHRWSYGIVLHEIYCFGQEPYQGMAPREVIVRVKAGYRLEKPEGCPNGV